MTYRVRPVAYTSHYCFTTNSASIPRNAWIVDSRAHLYICNDASWFLELYTFNTTVNTVSQGLLIAIFGNGTLILTIKDGDRDPVCLELTDVAYTLVSRCNLIALSKLAVVGLKGAFDCDNIMLFTKTGHYVGTTRLQSGLYHLQMSNSYTLRTPQPVLQQILISTYTSIRNIDD
jgi:hypothetical protein